MQPWTHLYQYQSDHPKKEQTRLWVCSFFPEGRRGSKGAEVNEAAVRPQSRACPSPQARPIPTCPRRIKTLIWIPYGRFLCDQTSYSSGNRTFCTLQCNHFFRCFSRIFLFGKVILRELPDGWNRSCSSIHSRINFIQDFQNVFF